MLFGIGPGLLLRQAASSSPRRPTCRRSRSAAGPTMPAGAARRCTSTRCSSSASALAVACGGRFGNTRSGLIVRMVGDSADAARAMGLSLDRVPLARHGRRRLPGRRRRRVPVALLPGSWNEGLSSRPGPDGGGAGDLRALGPACAASAPALLFGGAGALGPALQSVGVTQGYYFFNAAPYILTLAHHDRLGSPGPQPRRAGRTVDHQVRSHAMNAPRMSSATSTPTPIPGPSTATCGPDNTALIVIDMQTDFCGHGGYVDRMGYDLSLTRAPIEPIERVLRGHARQGLSTSSTPARATGPTSPTCPPTSAGARADRRRHRRPGALRPHPGARRAGLGDHPRAAPLPGEPIIDKPGKGSFCATDLELMLHTARHPQHRAHRHHHRRLRAHHDARGQRPRLRMPAARGLLRRHRPRQPPRRAQDGQDAGRRVRRGGRPRAQLLESLQDLRMTSIPPPPRARGAVARDASA